MRAKIAKFDALPYMDNAGEPIVGAIVPDLELPLGLKRRERLVELLSLAVKDCLVSGALKETGRIPLLVGLAEPGRPGGGADWSESILRDVQVRLDVRFDPKLSTALPKGNTAGFEALRLARDALQSPTVPACLVAGVDSLINAGTLSWLERHAQLKTTDNSDGVIPGEGAACVLLARSEAEPKSGCVARVLGLGFAEEEDSISNGLPVSGLGLANAARAALAEAGLAMHEIDFRFSDLGGEGFAFKEQSLALARLLKVRRECLPLWLSADTIGQTGAAAGVCALVVVLQAYRKRYSPGKRAICFTTARTGVRAAVVLERWLSRGAGSDASDRESK
jgi:3-oxoacyl-[acyl-carrier-protein] synthase-1